VSYHYAIDSVTVRNGRCFGWGWFLDDRMPPRTCELRVPLVSGGEQAIACVPAGMREDLRAAFPGVGHAISAGFLLQGKLQGCVDPARPAHLIATLVDGSQRFCEVPASLFTVDTAQRSITRALPALRAKWITFSRKLQAEGLHVTLRATARIAVEHWKRKAEQARGVYALRHLGKSEKRTVVVFDHAMGGGANHYSRDLIRRLCEAGDRVVVVAPLLRSLRYQIRFYEMGRALVWLADSPQSVLQHLADAPELDIHVNELVSFDNPLEILEWCQLQRSKQRGKLIMYLHDYHAVCPAWTLVSADGVFCNVPSPEVCRQCLPRNAANTLGFFQDATIEHWRRAWGAFLDSCDQINAFSQASVAILRNAHPRLLQARICVEPHQVDISALRKTTPTPGPPLVVAVAGHVSAPKGAVMIREMARLIQDEALPMRIVVFGTLEHHSPVDGLHVLGPYVRSELPALIESHRVGICLLPSVCAETFSFVTAEYMAMDMPVAVFPIGAPAERVGNYAKGLVISRIDAKAAVFELLAFAARMWPEAYSAQKQGL
jgi:glycosyltransferase involved in cell wall biosynthesis